MIASDHGDDVKLIGVGKSSHMSALGNWTNDNDVSSVCADVSPFSTWSEWGASQRDLYILNHEGAIEYHTNISGGFDASGIEDLVIELISQIPNEMIIGDVNGDELLNVVDIVLMINMILAEEYSLVADVNENGSLDVIDVVLMVNILVGGLPF